MRAIELVDAIRADKQERRLEKRKYDCLKFGHQSPSPVYKCPKCDQRYATVEQMLACFNKPREHGKYEVGDIVLIPDKGVSADHWEVDLDDPWLATIIPADKLSKDHFDRCRKAIPWFVITSLYEREHREVATCVSLVKHGPFYGWNPTVECSHYDMAKWGSNFDRAYWRDQLRNANLAHPCENMRAEANVLAAAGIVATNLL